MSIGHTQMSIRPLDEQKCPLDIHMSIRPLDEQKCPLDIQMSIRPLGKQKCLVDIQMSIRPMDEQKCPVDIQMSIGHLAEVLDMYGHNCIWPESLVKLCIKEQAPCHFKECTPAPFLSSVPFWCGE